MDDTTAGEARVEVELDARGVARVTLARPDKRNALDRAMFDALIAAGERLSATPELRCVVISGAGQGFCAGIDLALLVGGGAGLPPLLPRTHGPANWFQQAAMVWRAVPVPVIAAVHGVCFGGGLQIAGGADIRIVAPDARLAVMEAKWGIVPDMGHFVLWRGLVREDVLRELTWTAREFTGTEAHALGFASHVDPDPLDRALALAEAIAAMDPAATRAAKALANRTLELTAPEVLLAESEAQEPLLAAKLAQLRAG
jgi:enoyl-CoA hydratase/carnithine racemase